MTTHIEVKKGDKASFQLPTNNKNGVSVAPTVNGTTRIYEGTNPTPITAGATATFSLNSVPGVNIVEVDTSQPNYIIEATYHIVQEDMTIDGETPVNAAVGSFQLRTQSIDDIWGSGIIRAEWKWSTDTTATDPGSGNCKVNNTDYSLATALYISQSSRRGFNASAVLGTIKVNDYIAIAQVKDPDRFLAGQVTGAPTDNGAWWTVPISVQDSSSPTQIQNNQNVDVGFLIVPNDLTEQEVRDAMKLAPSAGSPATDSIDDKNDNIFARTDVATSTRQPAGKVDLNDDQSTVTVGTVNNVNDKTGYSLAAGQKVDVDSIKTNSDAATGLAASGRALIPVAVQAGSTDTSVIINSTFVGSLVGRNIAFYTGNILNEAASIGTSVQSGANTTITFVDADGNPATLSAAPAAGDLAVVL